MVFHDFVFSNIKEWFWKNSNKLGIVRKNLCMWLKSKNVDKNSNGLKKWTKTQIFESKPNKRNVEGKDKKILLREKNITGHPNTPASNFFRYFRIIKIFGVFFFLQLIEFQNCSIEIKCKRSERVIYSLLIKLNSMDSFEQTLC